MVNFRLSTILVFLWAAALYTHEAKVVDDVPFNSTYTLMYGENRLTFLDQGNLLKILIDDTYGDEGAEINSKQKFGSGFFGLKIQLPKSDSRGVNTLFYLSSDHVGQVGTPGALYFEFDGGNGSMPYLLKTHVYTTDNTSRTQEMNLWFDPTADLHAYKILWNQHQIVFYVDDTPIRVFKNRSNIGVNYPSELMHIVANTGANDWYWLPPVNWTAGPFIAYYRGFNIDGCPYDDSSSNLQRCYSTDYYWNRRQYWQLSPDDETKLNDKRKKYLAYDYCNDDKKGQFPECHKS